MEEVYTLEQVEDNLKIKFPKLFHKIYEKGAMDYLKHSDEWIEKNKEILKNTPEAFFYNITAEYEPLPFCNIKEEIEYFEDLLNYDDDYSSGLYKINPTYRFIPFGSEGGGDIFCFMFTEGKEEIPIVVYEHDIGSMKMYARDYEEFIFLQLALAALEWDQPIDLNSFEFHLQYISEEHRKLFIDKDRKSIRDKIEILGHMENVDFLVCTC